MTRYLAPLLSMLAALTVASSASAYTIDLDAPVSRFHDPGQRALIVARDYWHATPDCPDGVIERGFHDPQAPAMAALGCTIFWQTRFPMDPLTLCTSVVHEWGHLLGLGHSDNPRDTMYGGPIMTILWGRFRPANRAQAFCFSHGFARRWDNYNRWTLTHPRTEDLSAW